MFHTAEFCTCMRVQSSTLTHRLWICHYTILPNSIISICRKINLTNKIKHLEVKTCHAGTSVVQLLIWKLQIPIVESLRPCNHYSMKACAMWRLFIQVGNKHIICKQFQAAELFLLLKKKFHHIFKGFWFLERNRFKKKYQLQAQKNPHTSSLKKKKLGLSCPLPWEITTIKLHGNCLSMEQLIWQVCYCDLVC